MFHPNQNVLLPLLLGPPVGLIVPLCHGTYNCDCLYRASDVVGVFSTPPSTHYHLHVGAAVD